MKKFLVSVGEDGSGLGYNKFCNGDFDSIISEMELTEEEESIIDEELFSGYFYYVGDDNKYWSEIEKENGDLEVIEKEELKRKIKESLELIKKEK